VRSCEGEAIITGKKWRNQNLVSGPMQKRWDAPRTAKVTFLESGPRRVLGLGLSLGNRQERTCLSTMGHHMGRS
jgi:hypothetical protein